MDNKIQKKLAYVLLAFSIMFCCVSVMNGVIVMKNAYAFQNEKSEGNGMIDNITVKTVNDKIEEVEQVDKNELEYEDGISHELQMDVYTDEAGNIFIYNEENEVVSYAINYSKQDCISTLKLSQDEALSYGKKYLKEMVEDASKYSLQEISYDTYNQTYDIVFGYKICGIKTLDIVYLTIQNDGKLVYYSTPALNVFDTIKISPNYREKIEKQVEEQLKNLNGNTMGSFKIDDIVLAYNDEKFQYNASVTYIINQNGENIEICDTLFCDF